MNEYEHEPVRGLPETLPADEHIVWQGEPAVWPLARRVFHLRKVALYFLALIGLHIAVAFAAGTPLGDALKGAAWLAILAASALTVLGLLARLYARTTVYTLTNRRLVMRFGVALPMMINIPWDRVDAADLKLYAGGNGDIELTLAAGERLSYWLLWPHAKPWRFAPVRPMLRCVPDARAAAARLALAVGQKPAGTVTRLRASNDASHTPAHGTDPVTARPAVISQG